MSGGRLTKKYAGPQALATALGVDPGLLHLFPRGRMPVNDGELPAFARVLAGWLADLKFPGAVGWIQPMTSNLSLSLPEMEQLLGLGCGVTLQHEDRLPNGAPCLVTAGVIRQCAAALALRWSIDALAVSRHRVAWRLLTARLCYPLHHYLHFIELPSLNRLTGSWARGVGQLLRALATHATTPLGIYVRDGNAGLTRNYGPALDRIRKAMREAGLSSSVACQWIDGTRADEATADILDFARQHGIRVDCSLTVEGNHGADSRPYFASGAYAPMPFDLRVPLFYDGHSPVLEMPRLTGCLELTRSPEAVNAERLKSELFPSADEAVNRLVRTLDRARRNPYMAECNDNILRAKEWHDYNVFNWAPPPRRILRLLTFDALTLLGLGTPLGGMLSEVGFSSDGTGYVDACQMLGFLEQQAKEGLSPTASAALETQVQAHGYLFTGRDRLSGDSEYLIEHLPAHLGRTLELGCGACLAAARLIPRSSSYYGLDLYPEQAEALNALGGVGFVGDMHILPFDDSQFDTILADNTIEHSYDPLRVLQELRRVLAPQGRAYLLVPPDASTPQYQLRTHFWKIDARGLAYAARAAGLRIAQLETLSLTRLGYYCCFPASADRTCFVVLERDSARADSRAA